MNNNKKKVRLLGKASKYKKNRVYFVILPGEGGRGVSNIINTLIT